MKTGESALEFKPDFADIRPYYDAFWACGHLDRIPITLTLPDPDHPLPEGTPNWRNPLVVHTLSPEKLLDAFEEYCRSHRFVGLDVPCFYPNFGPDVFSAFLGADIKFSEDSPDTSWIDWSNPVLKDYDDVDSLVIDDANPVYQKSLELMQMAIERGKGRYITGITDLHASFDALAVLRGGPEVASIDMIENPEGVKRAIMKLFEAWKKVYDDYWAIVGDHQVGSNTWINIWAPGKMYPVQNDFSCLLGPQNYRDFLLEELQAEIDYLDYSIYHLDGVEALQHTDMLLEIDNLNAIQWVYGAGHRETPVTKWFDLYKRIQERHKSIQTFPYADEIPLMLKELRHEGLLIVPRCRTEDDVAELLRLTGWPQP